MRFAVIGAGNAGQSIAAYLVLRGHNLAVLYDPASDVVQSIAQRRGIEVSGPVAPGTARLRATDILDDAVGDADVILLAIPATAHQAAARALAPIVRPTQCVVICSTHVGSALLVRSEWQRCGMLRLPLLAETDTMPFSVRLIGPASVGIWGVNDPLHVAALPPSDTPHVIDRLGGVFPSVLLPALNSLEVGFNNFNAVVHPPVTLLNWGRIELQVIDRLFDYHEWLTPGIRRVTERLAEERGRVLQKLDLPMYPLPLDQPDWRVIGAKGPLPPSSWTFPPRYLEEDVPCGLVPVSSFGKLLAVPTPLTDAVTELASLATGRDFWSEGRTLEGLGLGGLSVAEILDVVR